MQEPSVFVVVAVVVFFFPNCYCSIDSEKACGDGPMEYVCTSMCLIQCWEMLKRPG